MNISLFLGNDPVSVDARRTMSPPRHGWLFRQIVTFGFPAARPRSAEAAPIQLPQNMLDFLSMVAHSFPGSVWCLSAAVVGLALSAMPVDPVAAASTGQLELTVVDKDTGQPIACRMHLIGPRKKAFKPEKVPYWHDHFVIPGKILLKLPVGNYSFVIERGLEYLQQEGRFSIEHFADDSKRIELRRFADMAADGWWSGDMEVYRPARDIELLMEADDLHVAEVITWQNDKDPWNKKPPEKALVQFDGNRFYHLLGGISTRSGTELLFLNLPAPLDLPSEKADYPPMLKIVSAAREKDDGWIDVAKPYGWDVPMLAAAGQIDSMQIANKNLCRTSTINDEGDGKPRDRKRYPSFKGNAEWSQEIYFRLLECGLRIPPTAGSGSGQSPNPVGYNRVYVQVDGQLTYEKWWQHLRAGAVFVTNGPLMKCSVEGQPPGHVFQGEAGRPLELEIAVTLSTRDPINYLEVVRNGHVEQEIRFDEYAKTGRLPNLTFDKSGWFLIRAVSNVTNTYRFAMTGPYYVEIGDERRISKQAAQFFLDWVYERARQIKLTDPAKQKEVLDEQRRARDFWQDILSKANAD